ncbi:Pentatricopeptide repeat-containing protein [Thalictrum thalictroides]|uniref:Pentatricopeptide repeat-containing protein n=1 Tax=Thalictrum thalictroides TaxID=46969 RepID=A0A7J6V2D2_THATH|nr:Pentatricopeptide repeat-containing protein [Thalictrum thalictroides]
MLSCLHQNHPLQALQILKNHILCGANSIDEVMVAIALKTCRGDTKIGSQIHGFAISSGFDLYLSVSNALISLYCKDGDLDKAFGIFNNLKYPDVVSWNSILSGSRQVELALEMHRNGVCFDAVTYASVLSFCSDAKELLLLGIQLHSLVMKSGFQFETYVGNALTAMYISWGNFEEAERVFDEMPHRDLVSWNALLSGYAQQGNYGSEGINVFVEMVRQGLKLDHVSFSSVIAACGHERSMNLGKQIHTLIVKIGYATHISVCNVLISMYSKFQVIDDANKVFGSMVERNVISWTTMISINEEDALSLFIKMRTDGVCPNEVTFVGLIHAISLKSSLREGQMIHGFCIKTGFVSELVVSNSLLTMYAKFESMEESKKVFDEQEYREIISWNALISGYSQNRLYQEALETYLSALVKSQPNQFTFGSVLNVIGAAEPISLSHGSRCHSHIIKLGFNNDAIVSGALLDMYAKRGFIGESGRVFEGIPEKSVVAWTTIISAHARHGDYESVMELFKKMEKEKVEPDAITFLSVLTACGRRGMVDMGLCIFDLMVKDHKIEPSQEHYSCLVDMLGRAGRLKEAENFLGKMPTRPGLSALQSLLGACKMHGNVDIGIRVGEALTEMEPMESGSYILMSNMYAEKGEWEKVAKIRRGMRTRGVKKEVGFSWVDVGNDGSSRYMHGFSSDDQSHPQAGEIYRMGLRRGYDRGLTSFQVLGGKYVLDLTKLISMFLFGLGIRDPKACSCRVVIASDLMLKRKHISQRSYQRYSCWRVGSASNLSAGHLESPAGCTDQDKSGEGKCIRCTAVEEKVVKLLGKPKKKGHKKFSTKIHGILLVLSEIITQMQIGPEDSEVPQGYKGE